jgi:hypothetical protein
VELKREQPAFDPVAEGVAGRRAIPLTVVR